MPGVRPGGNGVEVNKRKVVAGVGAVVGLATTGTAWSLWSARGETTSSGTATEARIAISAGPVNDLYPGGYRPVVLTVGNPNVYPVRIANFAVSGVSVDEQHASCPPGVVRLDPATASPEQTMAPQEERQFEIGVGLDEAAPESCKGATFTILYEAQAWVG